MPRSQKVLPKSKKAFPPKHRRRGVASVPMAVGGGVAERVSKHPSLRSFNMPVRRACSVLKGKGRIDLSVYTLLNAMLRATFTQIIGAAREVQRVSKARTLNGKHIQTALVARGWSQADITSAVEAMPTIQRGKRSRKAQRGKK
eukprot:TRINITY_DN6162_c0_g4_i1.p1 TRINITY_DN6162_c0_g4~~TRINITY_DN6162_c0_g4_i1.p1  ORF type:complete len:168 (+),score=30.50 TRINITY_DN6162_c0_g4_i1:74-505(+)